MRVARLGARSMYQKPRSDEQSAAFGRALEVMGDLYASAVGTTVLQHKEIPPRPARYDGALRLGKLPRQANEAAIRAALEISGVIVSCEVVDGEARVRFAHHGAPTRLSSRGYGAIRSRRQRRAVARSQHRRKRRSPRVWARSRQTAGWHLSTTAAPTRIEDGVSSRRR